MLSIQSEQGGQLAAGEDRPGSSDPLVDFTVPDGVNKLQVALKDLQGRGGSDFVYRIAVLDLSRPDFSLSLATDRIIVPAGGTQVVPIQVTRTSYNGPIELALEGMPAEIQLQGNIVPPGATIGLLTLSAQNVSPQAALARLVGRALEAQPQVARAATFADYAGSRYQPRVRTELGLAIAAASPIGIAWVPPWCSSHGLKEPPAAFASASLLPSQRPRRRSRKTTRTRSSMTSTVLCGWKGTRFFRPTRRKSPSTCSCRAICRSRTGTWCW